MYKRQVKHTFVVSGFDLIGGGNKPNAGTIFIPLKDWSEREAKAQDLAGKFMGIGMSQPDGLALVFNPPPIMGCLLYTSPSPRDRTRSRMPSSA